MRQGSIKALLMAGWNLDLWGGFSGVADAVVVGQSLRVREQAESARHREEQVRNGGKPRQLRGLNRALIEP
jgi:hypothetical protein